MESNELQNQLHIKQTELNYTKDSEARKKVENEISILHLKMEIEKIRDRIKLMNQR